MVTRVRSSSRYLLLGKEADLVGVGAEAGLLVVVDAARSRPRHFQTLLLPRILGRRNADEGQQIPSSPTSNSVFLLKLLVA